MAETGPWTSEQLDRIDAEDELQITSYRADGTARAYKKVWVVRVGDELYVRSVNGRGADWFRHVAEAGAGRIRCAGMELDVTADGGDAATEAVDDAYLTKYARYGERFARTMLRPPVVEAALRLRPSRGPRQAPERSAGPRDGSARSGERRGENLLG